MIALMAGIGAVLGGIMDGKTAIVPMSLVYAALGLALMPVLHVLVSVFVVPRRVRQLFRQQSSASLEQRWRWSDSGLEVENAQGLSRHSWTDLFGWRETQPSLLLYLNDRMFYALPRHAVAVEDWTDLIATLRRSGLAIH